MAGLILLVELRAWPYDVAALISDEDDFKCDLRSPEAPNP